MKKILFSAIAASSLMAADAEVETLQAQMAKMQEMMQAMQHKIDALESDQGIQPGLPVLEAEETATQPLKQPSHTPSASYADSFRQTSFIPDISLIVDASYVDRNMKDEEVQHMEIPGVAHGLIGSHSHGDHGHATYNANEGFNLNYAELAMHSSVDQWFDLDAVFHFTEYAVEIEEAYFTTNALPYGLRLRGGKFLSEFGRHNNEHHHAWSFADAPLVYHAFLGDHGIDEKGVQLQWVAPTPAYLMFGVELLQGENESMYGNDAITYDEVTIASSTPQPNLIVAYAKASADVGDTTVLGGVSYATGESRINGLDDAEEPHAFVGNSDLYGVDLSVKHYFDSYRYLDWQSEWLYRDMDGTKYTIGTNNLNGIPLHKKQAGYYTQLIYAHNRNWKAGARFDTIYKNDISNPNAFAPENLDRYTVMAEYLPSEFSRIRLQYNINKALYNEENQQQDVKSLILQMNLAIGAHAAHSF